MLERKSFENQSVFSEVTNVINVCILCVCSYDIIFSNGLFMYLSDTEVHSLFTKALTWLRPGGFMFFHETCFDMSGTVSYCTHVFDSKYYYNHDHYYHYYYIYLLTEQYVKEMSCSVKISSRILFIRSIITREKFKN